MKKFYLISAILIFMSALNVSAMNSELNLRLNDYSKFYLVIDGNMFNNNTNQYTISGLESGKHYLKVYKTRFNKYGGFSSMLVFSSPVFIPKNMIDTYNKYIVLKEEQIISPVCDENDFGYLYPMSIKDFNSLKMVIDNTSFDNSKLSIAKQAVSVNYITSRQVYELMNLLTFESSKLELAEFAYENTVDKNNYYIVNSAFRFSSSIDELSEWIILH